ncbi:type 4 fimbrial biosynthesis protein [Ramlibacter sp. G-1-2-2]|uniref:Type 4 fimbrial biosynthesis protein n=2 Tax=Ramlibacter agri TaxID=2728837 RepID=A0A848H013_9BURK|nr:type 4 fimbrial biosynthesis protein [Ramlibacter agri]
MVTVAIVAVLASIGYPAYTDYIRRGQLPEATAALSDYRVKMEQYFQDYKNYGTTNGSACANGTNAPGWSNFVPKGAKYFTYSCTVNNTGTVPGYILTATGSAAKAVGHVYTVNQDNLQTTTQFKGASVSGKNCWLMKGTEC